MSDWKGKSKLSKKKGRYGCSKMKGFMVLQELPERRYMSVRQLCLWTGISYYSLARALPNWVRWQYTARQPTVAIGEGDYCYCILAKGRSWRQLALEQLPNARIFLDELYYWRKLVMTSDRYERMRQLKFNDFVSELDRLIKANKGNLADVSSR